MLQTLASLTIDHARVRAEVQAQRLLTGFILSGLFFMLLPGTFLGVWNLVNISATHGAGALPPAWLQAHGQAQLFGWIGSFILGIGLYSLPKMRGTLRFSARLGWTIWTLWNLGNFMRWSAGVFLFGWRPFLALSGVLELAAFVLFARAVRGHRTSDASALQTWTRMVVAATVGFSIGLLINCAILLRQAIFGGSPSLPHVLDQQFSTLVIWGALVPMIWGFNARWLPAFAGFREAEGYRLFTAYGFSVFGVIFLMLGFWPIASSAFLLAALVSIGALQVWEHSEKPPKLLGVHPSFVKFVRITYAWLLISCILALLAGRFDHAGGFWGASRHALTVGFVAGMVFVIGQRILPAFCGMRVLWSKQLMLWSLLLLNLGCLLRVAAEPLAYENLCTSGWKFLPLSAYIELTAVTLFAINILVTLARPPAHIQTRAKAAASRFPVST